MNKVKISRMQFDEMLYQIRMLLTLKGGCSEEDVMNQFRNLQPSAVQAFIAEAIRRGIIEKERGTVTLRKLELSA
jgi:uncharacterized protein (DUF433 family)